MSRSLEQSGARRSRLCGWLLLVALAALSTWVSSLVEFGGKNPIEASALAVVLGLIVRNYAGLPSGVLKGAKDGDRALVWGIVLMGASLNYGLIVGQGSGLLFVVALTMLCGFVATYLICAYLDLPKKLSMLLAVGTTICGGTAVAVTAPLIRAREEETSYAVAVIALWGVAAILIYPAAARFAGMESFEFGVFAGTAIHSTPQVVGAGFIFSELAGKTATAVKLVRNCFMAPVALIIGLVASKENTDAGTGRLQLAKAFPWFLFGYFIMSWLSSRGLFSPQTIDTLTSAGKFLILLGMGGVGLCTDLAAFRRVGLRPLVAGLLGAICVAAASLVTIQIFL